MKIKTKKLSFEKVMVKKRAEKTTPKKCNPLLRTLVNFMAKSDLKRTDFSYQMLNCDELKTDKCLVFMNHSSFIDLEIAFNIFKKSPFNIICTCDGFVGKKWLMQNLGCIPTKKFVPDPGVISDMKKALGNSHVLIYPEASYSFDGCATPLPQRMGIMIKRLDVPVVMIKTQGAFAFDPLYNGLQKRNVKVSATVQTIVSKKDLAEKSIQEIDEIINKAFTFDNFRDQQENGVVIDEPFRADGLNRILYKCPHCLGEHTIGVGTKLMCLNCKTEYELLETGFLRCLNGETKFNHVPDWYAWERAQVKEELEKGTYLLDCDVDIRMFVDYKAIYEVGTGHLVHNVDGFTLNGCEGKLHYTQKPTDNYGLYADYYWYEIGDTICIGNSDALYYCFPKTDVPVAKARLAAEELYKLKKKKRVKSTENN